MAKIIVVEGPKGSGKTSSIKAAAKLLGVDLTNPIADIVMMTRLKLGRTIYTVGFAGSGDTADIIRSHLDFFGCKDLDYMIFASSAPKKGMPVLQSLATIQGSDLTLVNTVKMQNPTQAAIAAYVAQKGQEIANHIP